LYYSAGRSDLSLPLFGKAVQIRPDVFEAVLHLGIAEHDQGQLSDALAHLEQAVAIDTNNPEAHSVLGAIHADRNDCDAAIAAFHQALSLQPDSAEFNTKLALLYVANGAPEQAAVHFRKAILHNPLCGQAHYGIASLPSTTGREDDTKQMIQALRSPEISDHDKVLVGFALAKTHEKLADYDQAFEFLSEANRLQHESCEYSVEQQGAFFDRHSQALNSVFIRHCEDGQISDSTPILVLGMPRSGTSLVEQILASHPMVHGAGEVEYTRFLIDDVQRMTGKPFPQDIGTIAPTKLRDLGLEYVKRLKGNAGSAQRVVDKLPHNFLRVGLFMAIFPNAKIIICDRDALDNCMSIYQHYFSAYHGYASDLTALGEYYKLYENLMSFWMKLIPNHIYEINYERLVSNADDEIRQLLDYCELPFHADCLSFYKTQRMVVSPSALQVRGPMTGKSVGRAARYGGHLQELKDALVREGSTT